MEVLTDKFTLSENDARWVEEAERALKEPRLVSFKEAPCLCVKHHQPAPLLCHWHHIVPLSWGGKDEPSNEVSLCPTGHANVHRLHLNWQRAGEILPVRNGNRYLYRLAESAWPHRPR